LGQERTQREQTRHSGGRETGAGYQGPQHGSPDYQVLLSRYGEAMLKISQLEDQVSHLTGLLQDGVAQRLAVAASRLGIRRLALLRRLQPEVCSPLPEPVT